MSSPVWNLTKSALFGIDAETAHRMTVRIIQAGIRTGLLSASRKATGQSPPIRLWDLEFSSRIGLAAGFDKDAEILPALPVFGFGFAEIGTVTPRPQAGNDRPRLFRAPDRQAIFNRMGFNGLGAQLVSARLEHARHLLPSSFRVGVNIGKNKDTALEEAAQDYARAAAPFRGLADYIVVNVSSPNTPGLRSLQTVEALRPIIEAVNGVITSWPRRPPLLLKLAPEVRGEELAALMQGGESWGIDGWVLTNTLGGKWEELPGGWSGGPLTALSREVLAEARSMTRLPIISVGGIMSADEARLRLSMGADLVQIYSGWIYGGPFFPARLSKAVLQG